MSSEQLRTLVTALIQPETEAEAGAQEAQEARIEAEAEAKLAAAFGAPRGRRHDTEPEDPAAEFEAQPTTCLPVQRASTIDQLIAALQRPSMHRMRAVQPRRRSPRR